MTRRGSGTGSVLQRCEKRYGCPPLDEDNRRPPHKCKARWYGIASAGFTADGTRRRITVSGTGKKVVERRLRDKLLEIERDGAANTRRTVTVAKWTARWLEDIETKVRPTSLETDKAAARWIVKTIGHKKLSDLTPHDVRSVAAAIRSAGLSTSTALRYHGPLIRLLKAASDEGYNIPPNVLRADQPKAAVHDRQAIPLPHAIELLGHLTKRNDTGALILPDSSRWSLAFMQGIRQAEALGLTWDNVDLGAGTITIQWQVKSLKYRDKADHSKGFIIPDGYEVRQIAGAKHFVRPKSSSGWRLMPLIPWAVEALDDWQRSAPQNAQGLVWPGRTNATGTWPRNEATDRDKWATIQRNVGISHPGGRAYHVHEIRHTTATLLMALKVPESVRIAIMGHSAIASTKSYEHADITQARSALEGVGKMLGLE